MKLSPDTFCNKKKEAIMQIGCLKEIKNNEFRVGLTPAACMAYVEAGHKIFIEKGAGFGSGILDKKYEEAG
jgi:alanine dehydrogenase